MYGLGMRPSRAGRVTRALRTRRDRDPTVQSCSGHKTREMFAKFAILAAASVAAQQAPKVNVTLYSESLW